MNDGVRRRVVALARVATRAGWSRRRLACSLGLAPQTVHRWVQSRERVRDRLDRSSARPRPCGRPARSTDLLEREWIEGLIDEMGGRLSLSELKRAAPHIPRRELGRIRSEWHREHEPHPHRVDWLRVGATWAVDYTMLSHELSDGSRHLLLVRDLASRSILAAHPVRCATATNASSCLGALVAEHGAPLVLKSDNGSHFTGMHECEVHLRWKWWHLRSPVRTPEYNGSIEAGASALKASLSSYGSMSGGAVWTTPEDVEAERVRANGLSRPAGPNGPSAAELWRDRRPLSDAERRAFHDRASRELSARLNGPDGQARGTELTTHERATVVRSSIRRALDACGLIKVKKKATSSGESNADVSH